MLAYKISRRAENNLADIVEYISKDSSRQADIWLANLYEIFTLIADNPKLGKKRSDFTSKEVRFYPFGNYLIIYRVTKIVEILRVISSYREVRGLLKKLF